MRYTLVLPIGWMVRAGRPVAAAWRERKKSSATASPVAASHLKSRSSSSIMRLSCSNSRRVSPFLKLLMPPSRVGPGSHPGMARRALAGLIDAGSAVVATTNVAICGGLRRRDRTERVELERKQWFLLLKFMYKKFLKKFLLTAAA